MHCYSTREDYHGDEEDLTANYYADDSDYEYDLFRDLGEN